MKKLIIDYCDFDDNMGSVFYFETLDEIFDFIKTAAENSYHCYYIEDYRGNED